MTAQDETGLREDDEPGTLREGSLTPSGNVIGPKAWRLIVALSEYDDWLGAVMDVVDEAALATAAPAGLDLGHTNHYEGAWELGCPGCFDGLVKHARKSATPAPAGLPCAQCETWRKEYNAAVANGLSSQARSADRRIAAHERKHATLAPAGLPRNEDERAIAEARIRGFVEHGGGGPVLTNDEFYGRATPAPAGPPHATDCRYPDLPRDRCGCIGALATPASAGLDVERRVRAAAKAVVDNEDFGWGEYPLHLAALRAALATPASAGLDVAWRALIDADCTADEDVFICEVHGGEWPDKEWSCDARAAFRSYLGIVKLRTRVPAPLTGEET